MLLSNDRKARKISIMFLLESKVWDANTLSSLNTVPIYQQKYESCITLLMSLLCADRFHHCNKSFTLPAPSYFLSWWFVRHCLLNTLFGFISVPFLFFFYVCRFSLNFPFLSFLLHFLIIFLFFSFPFFRVFP
jgi:hypothetical protein